MEKFDQDELFDARRERDKGIKTAIDHADSVIPSWSDHAVEYVRAFCEEHTEPFVTNELRACTATGQTPIYRLSLCGCQADEK